jgi:hypothetical protein
MRELKLLRECPRIEGRRPSFTETGHMRNEPVEPMEALTGALDEVLDLLVLARDEAELRS